MKVGILIQARMGSTRLPGKISLPLGNGTVLGFMIERLKASKFAENIVILTTEDSLDDVTVDIAKSANVKVFRGSSEDLIKRYLEAVRKFQFDVIIRLTGDCPLIDPRIVDAMADLFLYNVEEARVEFLTNCFKRSFARGMDVEVFTAELLEHINLECKAKHEREHVVPYIEENRKKYKFLEYSNQNDDSDLRLTVDTEEDYKTICSVVNLINQNIGIDYTSLIKEIRANPGILVNAGVHHKEYTE